MARTRRKDTSPTLETLLAILRQHLPELRQHHGVRSLGIFGSYVRDQQRRSSDVDVLVEFERAPSLFRFIDVQDELSALLGVKVDLVMKSALRPVIGKRILKEVVSV